VFRSSDGDFVNLDIIRHGYARPLTIPPNVAFADRFLAASQAARADNIGLWAACAG
jgi:micrococcal nuclease